ncbi:MAG: hypothetical protein J3R72DRAFT_30049 [Linnemannia gamsii]|nr:hypothetical protein BGX24_006393 [Mortierella sp. AD032]KAK3845450.1 MAG: hypothetical protein J3R72DRAFT_30049 [Linnemannia gamsii]
MPRIPLNVASTLPRKLGRPPKSLPLDFSPTDADARSLFRTLWRVGSLSVMYTNPGRDVIRRKIREAFEESRQHLNTNEADIRQQWERALNTRYFFEIASTRFGVEHSVISNLTRVAAENSEGTTRPVKPQLRAVKQETLAEYQSVVHALNESLGLSLRC